MKQFFERAVANITTYGDTDIFPFPIENLVFYDKTADAIDLLLDIDNNFRSRLAETPPSNYSALTPVSYTGFRWATQIDPIWNAYLLGLVISIAKEIEARRIASTENVVFSYRFNDDATSPDLFRKEYNWRSFMERSLVLAQTKGFVVICDISEFYSRLNHHRLENALKQLGLKGNQTSKIMEILQNFSGTYSFGMPVGGPAARMLSELLLNQIDSLLRLEGIEFCRFADDYHLFSDSYEGAFRNLVFLSEKLLMNQGLQLQKSKTRIMTGSEFVATSPLGVAADDTVPDEIAPDLAEQSHNLMRLSLYFDPYSLTAKDDYEVLRGELKKIDIFALLKAELVKSRIHISLSKKIVSAIRFIEEPQRSDAVLSLITNEALLYPIYSNVLWVVTALYDELPEPSRKLIVEHVRKLVNTKSHVVGIELNLLYAVRLLACSEGPENEEILNRVFKGATSVAIRRDIILAMARWKAWPWLSDLKNVFRTLSPMERRAFIVASYMMSDEGKHWRQHISPELSVFEDLVKGWMSEKTQQPGWRIPV
jgi:hypothetical protein